MTNINNVIIGVDTHKATHVAVAIDNNGSRLAAFSAPATIKGYSALEDWASALGTITSFGIEGTGSYGAGLSRLRKSKHNPLFKRGIIFADPQIGSR